MASFAPRLPPTNSDGEVEPMSGGHDNDDNNSNAPQHRSIQCCCGRAGCAYLEHNNAALGGLERDLETAARLGQALLSRHETYITESRAEHARMSEHISELEADRSSLQNANEKIVAENRELLSKLEALNGSLANSDDEVGRLEALLLDCELEVKRLNGLVRRTEGLDGRVAEMERENLELNKKIDESQANSKNTLVRWRQSQRKVRELEEEVRRIEAEAAHDREKHEDIVARMEKESLLERELGGAEGRLKGAAAVQSIKTNGPGSKNVVSHFVRDILQDNANLQAGIAELRELLQSSNEEVQNLREQILLHQPMHDEDDAPPIQQPSLDEEMASSLPSPKRLQQEVHVHHHYHAKIGKKPTAARRSNKRRAIMPGTGYTSDSSSPTTPRTRSQQYFSNPNTTLGHNQPQSYKSNRWSMQSTATSASFLSSIPSSPRSYFDRNGSLFDRMEHEEELSRPTSPESMSGMISPGLRIFKGRKAEESELTPFEEEEREEGRASPLLEEREELREQTNQENIPQEKCVTQSDYQDSQEFPEQELTPKPSVILNSSTGVEAAEVVAAVGQDPSPSLPELEHSREDNKTADVDIQLESPPTEPALLALPEIRPSIRRVASHESLVSISGMDIHIAQRPVASLKLLKGNSTHFALSPSPNRKISTAEPLASVTEYTAVSSIGSEHGFSRSMGPSRVPASVEALSGIAVPKSRTSYSPAQQPRGLGRLVGGWVRGKWGVAPAKSYSDLRSVSDNSTSGSIRSTPSTLEETAERTTMDSESAGPKIEVLPATPPRKIPGTNRQEGATSVPSSVNIADIFGGRSSGVNQSGFIPGFRAALMSRRTPSEIQAQVIDEEGLREGLAEGV